MDNQTNIRVMIVDDHQLFIDGIKQLFETDKQINFVSEALNGKQAIEALKNTPVDIAIVDIEMPELNGIELTKYIKANCPETKVLVLTMYNDTEIINEILMAESEGYVLKNTDKKELKDAILKISNGGMYYSSKVLEIIKNDYGKSFKKSVQHKIDLTPREIEIIQLIYQEYSTKEISEKLHISYYTVETHRKNILKKTKVKSIVGLIKYAMENKILI